MDYAEASPAQVDWQADAYWRTRPLTPAQLQIHDVRLEGWRTEIGAMLEMREVLSSSLLPELDKRDRLSDTIPLDGVTKTRYEQNHLRALAVDYGWMNCLRSSRVQENISDPPEFRKCRWIHISSKFSDYLPGCLLALADWKKNPERIISALRQLDNCINQNERFSKHGRYFTPFVTDLLATDDDDEYDEEEERPMLLSVPFIDWTVDGETPPLRFQVDPREGYQSGRSSSHLLRSILQHFYRLEDTADRESHQVFTKHKPWQTDRDLDLKVRRWYGHYPTALNVDELWMLVIDARHVITFSSNQSWKSRWPPLQLSARIMEVSFRNIRNSFLNMSNEQDYTSYTHVITALSGAVGMLHRSFWHDITLCLSDRYASYLGHLQYRLHRSPSAKLVMDLLQAQEELNIIIQIMDQQMELVAAVQETLNRSRATQTQPKIQHPSRAPTSTTITTLTNRPLHPSARASSIPHADTPTYRQLSSSHSSDPATQLLSNLHREHTDLTTLLSNSNTLTNRTIQLVNMRLEDHGKAILVFTIITIIFLPLSFVSSFFGMNFSNIRDMDDTTTRFWIVASALTVGTTGGAMLLAFYGGWIAEVWGEWLEGRRRSRRANKRRPGAPPRARRGESGVIRNFEVLDVLRPRATDVL